MAGKADTWDGWKYGEVFASYDTDHMGLRSRQLLVWVRVRFNVVHLLVIQTGDITLPLAVDPSPPAQRVIQVSHPRTEARPLLDALDRLFPDRDAPQLQDTSTPETSWTASLSLIRPSNRTPIGLSLGIGPEGIRGADAPAVHGFFSTVFDAVGLTGFSILTEPQPDP